MTAGEGMKFLAPLTGAGLYAAYGGAGVAVLDTVTFALAAGLYALLRVRETPPVPDRSAPRARTAEGLGHSPAYVGLLRVWAQVAPVNTVRTASRSPSEANPAW